MPALPDPKDLFGGTLGAGRARGRLRRTAEGARDGRIRVALIGAPTDIGAGDRGASMGPEALRVAGLQTRCEARHRRRRSRQPRTVRAIPGSRRSTAIATCAKSPTGTARCSTRCGAELAPAACRSCSAAITASAIGSISAVARHCRDTGKKLRVLWLDAHADFNTSVLTPSGNIHGMPVACLCGFGPRELTRLGGSAPAIEPAQIRQIGIRSVDQGEKRFVHEHGLEVFDMRYIDEVGMRRAMEQALAGVDADTHLHVSFDVDFLDPDIAPGVGTTVPGGPNYREAQLCMEMIADTGRLGVAGHHGAQPGAGCAQSHGASVAVDLIERLFGKSTLMRPQSRAEGREFHATIDGPL